MNIFETTVRGGLVIEVGFEYSGYKDIEITDIWISKIGDKVQKKNPEWLWNKMSQADTDKIYEMATDLAYDMENE